MTNQQAGGCPKCGAVLLSRVSTSFAKDKRPMGRWACRSNEYSIGASEPLAFNTSGQCLRYQLAQAKEENDELNLKYGDMVINHGEIQDLLAKSVAENDRLRRERDHFRGMAGLWADLTAFISEKCPEVLPGECTGPAAIRLIKTLRQERDQLKKRAEKVGELWSTRRLLVVSLKRADLDLCVAEKIDDLLLTPADGGEKEAPDAD